MTRKLFREKENGICREAKSNPKKFWKYVKSKLKTRTGIADTEAGEQKLASTDKDKAEVLSTFFSSVFTRETSEDMPTLPA